MEKLNSEGKCIYCDGIFSKSQINRHLHKHLAEKTAGNKPGKSFLVKVETNPKWGSTPYFLSLWVNGECKMDEIDNFLRMIWLECCGHMSSFTNPANKRRGEGMFDYFDTYKLLDQEKIKEYEKIIEDAKGEVSMRKKAKTALYKGLKLNYQYDFGSTTELLVSVIEEYAIKADKSIVLLSRNEPPELLCEKCGKEPARQLCMICYGYRDEGLFCAKCAKKHARTCNDFAEYSAMPIVNSPRMGVCGYDGGTIDKKRDGVLKHKLVTPLLKS